jgi:hypothetical protein
LYVRHVDHPLVVDPSTFIMEKSDSADTQALLRALFCAKVKFNRFVGVYVQIGLRDQKKLG